MSRKRGYDVWCKSCGCIMKLRDGKFGEFWGCTGYPKCKATMSKRDAALEIIEDNSDTVKDDWRD